jgi:hypothetical protein
MSSPEKHSPKIQNAHHGAHRRNLSPVDFKLALGRRYNRTKKANGERGAEKLDQNEPAFTSTAAKLATQHGVSEAYPLASELLRNALPWALRLTGKKHASPFENHFTSTLKHLINDHH